MKRKRKKQQSENSEFSKYCHTIKKKKKAMKTYNNQCLFFAKLSAPAMAYTPNASIEHRYMGINGRITQNIPMSW